MLCEIINIDLYRTDLMLFIGNSGDLRLSLIDNNINKRSADKVIRLLDVRDFWSGSNKGFCYQFKGGQILIVLPELPDAIEKLGTLNHEILHAVFFILKKVGVVYSIESEESYTYLYGYLTEKIYRLMPISFSCPSL